MPDDLLPVPKPDLFAPESHLLTSLFGTFLITVALSVAAIAALAGLFVTLSPWVQRHCSALISGLVARKHR